MSIRSRISVTPSGHLSIDDEPEAIRLPSRRQKEGQCCHSGRQLRFEQLEYRKIPSVEVTSHESNYANLPSITTFFPLPKFNVKPHVAIFNLFNLGEKKSEYDVNFCHSQLSLLSLAESKTSNQILDIVSMSPSIPTCNIKSSSDEKLSAIKELRESLHTEAYKKANALTHKFKPSKTSSGKYVRQIGDKDSLNSTNARLRGKSLTAAHYILVTATIAAGLGVAGYYFVDESYWRKLKW